MSTTIVKRLSRWTGYRSEVMRAAEIATEAITDWSERTPAESSVRTEFRGGITESQSLDEFARLPRSELARIEECWLWIRPDEEARRREYAAWLQETWEQRERGVDVGDGPGPLPRAEVSIRMDKSWFGLTVEVKGPSRTNVEGLHTRLIETLARDHHPLPFYSRFGLAVTGVLLAVGFGSLGFRATQWLGYAQVNGVWDRAEIIGLATGALIPLMAVSFIPVFPTLEVLDDGEKSRFVRYRRGLFSVMVALVSAVVAAILLEILR